MIVSQRAPSSMGSRNHDTDFRDDGAIVWLR